MIYGLGRTFEKVNSMIKLPFCLEMHNDLSLRMPEHKRPAFHVRHSSKHKTTIKPKQTTKKPIDPSLPSQDRKKLTQIKWFSQS